MEEETAELANELDELDKLENEIVQLKKKKSDKNKKIEQGIQDESTSEGDEYFDFGEELYSASEEKKMQL